MQQKDFIFTSESVTEGHPDKICDQISDAILDAIIDEDKSARVACETLVNTGMVVVAGEITTNTYVPIPDIVRETVRQIGYTDSKMGFDCDTCAVLSSIDRQSPDISQGVTAEMGLHKEQGAGDQGIMFGYACRDTDVLMPAPIYYAHQLVMGLSIARNQKRLAFLRPDGKSQVTMEYRDGKPVRIHTVVVATQHTPDVSYEDIIEGVKREVIFKALPEELLDDKTIFHINATGRFVLGGPQADSGVTGRKIIVDTYGGMGRHGGGAFSGKDPSKVDRTASYMARYIAKNIVAAGLADNCELQLGYVIGVAEPVSVLVETFGTEKVDPAKISKAVRDIFPLKPAAMIKHLDLLRPIYQKTAAFGHFGREVFTWERTDKVEELKSLLG
ncbi:MAG: methionine adenosyltransferase [Candidatus Lernaella stagnicola]|nr:methionine adenosyltransferase [Candidatus Lernaella stagnicola]